MQWKVQDIFHKVWLTLGFGKTQKNIQVDSCFVQGHALSFLYHKWYNEPTQATCEICKLYDATSHNLWLWLWLPALTKMQHPWKNAQPGRIDSTHLLTWPHILPPVSNTYPSIMALLHISAYATFSDYKSTYISCLSLTRGDIQLSSLVITWWRSVKMMLQRNSSVVCDVCKDSKALTDHHWLWNAHWHIRPLVPQAHRSMDISTIQQAQILKVNIYKIHL